MTDHDGRQRELTEATVADVLIRALRSFNRTQRGDVCDPGDEFAVDETRAGEFVRLELAELVVPLDTPDQAEEPPAPEAGEFDDEAAAKPRRTKSAAPAAD